MLKAIIKFICVLVLLLGGIRSASQELTLYVIPAKCPMNWASPQKLLVSNLNNLLVKTSYPGHRHFIGHVIVELRDSSHYAILGMVSSSSIGKIAKDYYFRGYGLGIFFVRMPGKIEEGSNNEHQLTDRYAKGDIAFIRFKLSDAAFMRLWQYEEQYKILGYDKIYNGDNKPREGKGAGCSAFGVSFIELGGLMSPNDLDVWKVQVRVPLKLIGGTEDEQRKVSIIKVALARKWADTSSRAYRPLAIYEPTLMYDWIEEQWKTTLINKERAYTKEMRGMSHGIVYDCRELGVPDGPLFTSGE